MTAVPSRVRHAVGLYSLQFATSQRPIAYRDPSLPKRHDEITVHTWERLVCLTVKLP